MNERDYGTAPILKLFFRCTVPAMVGMGFSAIYNITDGIFVGHFIGQEALAAVNLVMPLIMIITALADMVAAGSSVRISILLGQEKREEAGRVFTVCLKLIIGLSLLFTLAGFFLAGPLIRLMGADGLTAEYAEEYLRVFALFMCPCCLYFSTDNYLRVCGKVKLSMTINIVCSVLNIILDAVLIVWLKQGLWAAALASSLSMTVGAVWSLIPFIRKKLPLILTRGRIAVKQIALILTNGSSEFFTSMAGSLLAIIINVILLRLGGATAVAAVAIVEYVQSLTGMIIYSASDALQPAISYCYGAGLYKRMKDMLKTVMAAAAILSLIAMVFLLTAGRIILPLFIKDGDTALFDMSWRAMRFFALSYLVSWIEMTLAGYLTALEKPWHSLVLSILGTLIFPLIFLAILVPLWGLDGVWMLNVVSGTYSAIVAIVIVKIVKIK
ncbi:MAG: MATE family efflux transporter [Bacteroidales bacterium]|nr:MATE family efflux transporter [Bacteroidales bacterium]